MRKFVLLFRSRFGVEAVCKTRLVIKVSCRRFSVATFMNVNLNLLLSTAHLESAREVALILIHEQACTRNYE